MHRTMFWKRTPNRMNEASDWIQRMQMALLEAGCTSQYQFEPDAAGISGLNRTWLIESV